MKAMTDMTVEEKMEKSARLDRWVLTSLAAFVVALVLAEMFVPYFGKLGLVSAGLFWAFWITGTLWAWDHHNEAPGTT
jgi:hypothetical protein